MGNCSICTFVLLIFALVASTQAARRIHVQEQMLRSRRSSSENQETTPIILGLTKGEDLEEETEIPTAHGTKKVKLVERYGGVPIVGATAVLERDSGGHFVGGSSGHLVTDIDDDISSTVPKLSADEAVRVAIRQNGHQPDEVRFDDTIDSKLEIILEDSEEEERPVARLVYRTSYMVQTKDDLERPFTLIDALTGDVVQQWNGLSLNRVSDKNTTANATRVQGAFEISGVGGNLKMGKANYGKDFPKLKVDISCMLENNVAKVFSCKGSRCSTSPYAFNCREGFNDSINGAYSPMRDALFYISATYEMFDQWYGIKNPLQRKGSSETVCKARIHYGYRFENAFWDGRYITFGDGYNKFYPLTSINVVAHEISHGITEMNSGLIYRGESGGMNEAFSDMAGEAVEYFATKKQDWMVGYEIFKDPEGALRYFVDPNKDGKSIGALKEYCPGINVHYSSGLFNRAFYFLGETKGWDVKKAFHPFVLANQLYWTQNSRFHEGACGVVQAAKDLDLNAKDVAEAFRKVGIEPCVDTSRGAAATAALKAPKGHTILVDLAITDDMDIKSVKIQARVQVPSTIKLSSPTCTHCVESVRGYSTKTFDICEATPGLYQLAITPTERDMWRSSVAFFGPSHMLADNITLTGYSAKYHFQFEMPKYLDKYEFQATISVRSVYGRLSGYLRYKEKPDLSNYTFDKYLPYGSESLICNPKPGTWHMILRSHSSRVRGGYVQLKAILTGRRVDQLTTEPPPTTVAPTEEGSGSGSEERLYF